MPHQVLGSLTPHSGCVRRLIAASLFLFLAALQSPAGEVTPANLPHLNVPEATTLPRLDASPQDAAWASAAVITNLGLSIHLTSPGVPAPATHVYVLWSPGYLYVRFICDGAKIYAPFDGSSPRLYMGDVAEVFLDPVGDARQWYEVEISPRGGLLEKNWIMTNALEVDQDDALTPEALQGLWEDSAFKIKGLLSAAKITPTGWIADLGIPAATILRRSGSGNLAPGTLRANFIRYQWPLVRGTRVMVPLNWSRVRQGCPHISPGAMGFLVLQPGH